MSLKVGVVRGGISPEYQVSLGTGEAILKAIKELAHDADDVFITKNGDWINRGFSASAQKICQKNDVIWNCLHGEYGEDGKFEDQISGLGAKIIGKTGWGSALTLNKDSAKRHAENYGFPVFPHIVIKPEDENRARKVHNTFSGPWIIKPLKGGSSLGINVAKSFPELEEKLSNIEIEVIVEPFYKGREIIVGVVPELRGKKWYSTIVLELKKDGHILSYEDLEKGEYRLLPLKDYGIEQKHALSEMAELVGDVFGLNYMYLTQWIETPRGYFLIDIDALPALDDNSIFRKSTEHSGVNLKEIVESILKNI